MQIIRMRLEGVKVCLAVENNLDWPIENKIQIVVTKYG